MRLFKKITLIIFIIFFGNSSIADDHLSDRQIIKNLKQKIIVSMLINKKKSLFQKNKEYVKILKDQLRN